MIFEDPRLKSLIKTYLYQEYADDLELQAFIEAFNAIAQGYLDWFNNTPLAMYIDPAISGPLLDWVGANLYGIPRPLLGNQYAIRFAGTTNSYPTNYISTNDLYRYTTGSTGLVNDDVYRRVHTWFLYKGDGMQMAIDWLQKRVARFLFGDNGGDVSNDYLQYVSLTQGARVVTGATNSYATDAAATNSLGRKQFTLRRVIVIRVQDSIIAQQFQQLMQQGWLNKPFQMTYIVELI